MLRTSPSRFTNQNPTRNMYVYRSCTTERTTPCRRLTCLILTDTNKPTTVVDMQYEWILNSRRTMETSVQEAAKLF